MCMRRISMVFVFMLDGATFGGTLHGSRSHVYYSQRALDTRRTATAHGALRAGSGLRFQQGMKSRYEIQKLAQIKRG